MYIYKVGNRKVKIIERYTHTCLVEYRNGKQSSVHYKHIKAIKLKPQKTNQINIFTMKVDQDLRNKHEQTIRFNSFAYNWTANQIREICKELGAEKLFVDQFIDTNRKGYNQNPFMFYTFFNELSYDNRVRVCEWINNNYKI